jgi:hypothetical protein
MLTVLFQPMHLLNILVIVMIIFGQANYQNWETRLVRLYGILKRK